MNKIIRISFLMILIWSYSSLVWAASNSACDSKPVSVYIDPFFGGQEAGPNVGAKYKAKDVVLNFAVKLEALLEKKGITACLSRDGDYSLTLDERFVKAKVSQSKVYFAITMSKNKNCINLHIPKASPRSSREGENIDLDTIYKDIAADDKIEGSLALAHGLRSSIGEKVKQACVNILAEKQSLLSKASGPIVIMDISVTKDFTPFMSKTILSDGFINAVADALASHVTSTQET
jgi:hypothetical protein